MLTARLIILAAATFFGGLLSGCEQRPIPKQDSVAAPLKLLNDCPDTLDTCVEMLLNLGDRLYGKIDPYRDFAQGEMDEMGYLEFIIPVKGRLNGADAVTHRLSFRSYTDGINCGDFGQSYVASLGFSNAGNPVLLSSAGLLELVDSSFEVGCSECGGLFSKSTGERVLDFTTPSWDMTLVGLTASMENHFFFDDDARVFLNHNSGSKMPRCLQVGDDKMFRVADAANCTTTTRIIGLYGFLAEGAADIAVDPGERLLENSDSPSYYMKVFAGGCT